MWTMFFDGSNTQDGSWAGCVLIDLGKGKALISCRLKFECTNNTAKYEALVQGLKKAIDLKVKYLKVFGDSEIILQ
jgi:ribonuclease HI